MVITCVFGVLPLDRGNSFDPAHFCNHHVGYHQTDAVLVSVDRRKPSAPL
jgi:hypothetical protein